MSVIRCSRCNVPLTGAEAALGSCPVCHASVTNVTEQLGWRGAETAQIAVPEASNHRQIGTPGPPSTGKHTRLAMVLFCLTCVFPGMIYFMHFAGDARAYLPLFWLATLGGGFSLMLAVRSAHRL